MCFSIEVVNDLKKLSKIFDAEPNYDSFTIFENLMKIQNQSELKEFENLLGLKHHSRRTMPILKKVGEDKRIFPNFFTELLTMSQESITIEPMRYRIRPQFSETEVPTKYNLFNARLDQLNERKTWKKIFMKNHAVLPIVRFFEWVDKNQQKKLIAFQKESKDLLYAPCLWDQWESIDNKIQFKSFAVITTDPPDEILKMGHDRCPIVLTKDQLPTWLNPQKHKKEEIYNLLNNPIRDHFRYQWAE